MTNMGVKKQFGQRLFLIFNSTAKVTLLVLRCTLGSVCAEEYKNSGVEHRRMGKHIFSVELCNETLQYTYTCIHTVQYDCR